MQTREHPDELTPREREVLDLLRLGLTNEEIAERLGISLDGAKYHVSQILSKLGVSSREEAAAVVLAARRGWWAALPLVAKAAGAAIVVAAVAGLGVLAWGVWRTSGEGDGTAQPGAPNQPANVRVAGNNVVFEDRSDNEDGFRVYANCSGRIESTFDLPADRTFLNVFQETPCVLGISAFNAAGESAISWATAGPEAPTADGPRIGDHWHAQYTFTACGELQPNARVWDSGVNTESDGIIHIHPSQTFEEGSGASLVRWFDYGGGKLTFDSINIPGFQKTFQNGDLCPNGGPSELQVFVTWAGQASEHRLDGDALLQYIPQDGDRIRIVFGPPD